jgi:hypothetical protein
LNPIESLWGAIKKTLRWKRVRTTADAINVVKRVWADFPQEAIDSLVGSFANRVKMVGDARGRTIQPLVSAGKTQVPPGYADESETRPQWDAAADSHLEALVAQHGPKWRVIVQFLPGFSSEECKARYLFLSRRNKIHKPPEIGI